MILITISPYVAKTSHVSKSKYNFIYLSLIAIMVILGVRIIGKLMTAALVTTPVSTSRNLGKSLIQYAYFSSMFFGGISCILGTVISYLTNMPIGSAIILSNLIFFVGSLFIRR